MPRMAVGRGVVVDVRADDRIRAAVCAIRDGQVRPSRGLNSCEHWAIGKKES